MDKITQEILRVKAVQRRLNQKILRVLKDDAAYRPVLIEEMTWHQAIKYLEENGNAERATWPHGFFKGYRNRRGSMDRR